MVDRDLRLRRARAQLLDCPVGWPVEEVVGRLLAVQAQDRFAYPHALRVRRADLRWSDVDCAISRDRSLVVGWLNRGTIQLVRREDYPWLVALTGPRSLTGSARRLAILGLSAEESERGVNVVERALADEGPLGRTELRDRLRRAGIASEGQTLLHILHRSVTQGRVVMGPLRPEGQSFAHIEDWLGSEATAQSRRIRAGEGRDVALAELARRYLVGHGPAGERDLAKWSGLSLGDVRTGLRAIAAETVDAGQGMVDLANRRDEAGAGPDAPLPPRLLPAFDAALLGWQSRFTFVPHEHEAAVYGIRGGLITGVFTVDGLARGTWRIRRMPPGKAPEVSLEPYEPLTADVEGSLASEIADVRRFERERAVWRAQYRPRTR